MQNERREAREAEAQREAESGGGEIQPSVEGNSDATCTTIPARGRGRPEEFASETAAVTGKDKSTINRAIRRATAVCQEARDLIRGTALDTGSDLDSLAKKDLTNEGAKP